MKLRQCDHCGRQESIDTKWYRIVDESTVSSLTILDMEFAPPQQRDLCSWECVRDYAVLKLTEAEVSA